VRTTQPTFNDETVTLGRAESAALTRQALASMGSEPTTVGGYPGYSTNPSPPPSQRPRGFGGASSAPMTSRRPNVTSPLSRPPQALQDPHPRRSIPSSFPPSSFPPPRRNTAPPRATTRRSSPPAAPPVGRISSIPPRAPASPGTLRPSQFPPQRAQAAANHPSPSPSTAPPASSQRLSALTTQQTARPAPFSAAPAASGRFDSATLSSTSGGQLAPALPPDTVPPSSQ